MITATANRKIALAPPSKIGDATFKLLTWSMAMMVFVLVVLVAWELFEGSKLSLQQFGWNFLLDRLGPRQRRLWRLAFHLRDLCFLAAGLAHRAAAEPGHGHIFDGTGPGLGCGSRPFP